MINRNEQEQTVQLCPSQPQDGHSSPCSASYPYLEKDQAATERGGALGVEGEIHYPDGSVTYIKSDDPNVGEPYIHLSTDRPGGWVYSTGDVALNVNETKTVTVRDHTYDLNRQADTSYKVMRLIIK